MSEPRVELFYIEGDSPYPWRFRIHHNGQVWEFAGTPNMCSTKRQAAMRAWWRARWIKQGIFDQRYQ